MKQPKINRVRYWKKEKPKSTWELVGDTEQDLPLVVKKGAMFVTWNAFSESPKGNGHGAAIHELSSRLNIKYEPNGILMGDAVDVMVKKINSQADKERG